MISFLNSFLLAELICKELKSLNDFLLRVPDALAVPGGGEVSGSRKMLKVCGKRGLFMWQKRPIYCGEVSGARKTLKVTARTHTVVHTHTRTRACTHTHTQTIGCSQNAQDLCTHARVHTHTSRTHPHTYTTHIPTYTHTTGEDSEDMPVHVDCTTRFYVDAHACKHHSCMYTTHHQQEKTARICLYL
jgi:hypothetical protein